MPTFGDISKQPDGYRALPQAPLTAVTLLWHSDFWDGPRSGLLVYAGEQCWFEVVAENDDPDLAGWYRRFAIIRLTPAQLADEQRWHELFRANVGWHTDYVKDAPDRYAGLRPREQWRAFYDLYEKRVPLDLSGNEVLAWFED
jgi:hypothetical protein